MTDRGAVVVDPTDDEETNVRIKRSVCHSYTVLLLLLIVRESSDVDYLQRFGAKLLAFTAQGAYVTAAPFTLHTAYCYCPFVSTPGAS